MGKSAQIPVGGWLPTGDGRSDGIERGVLRRIVGAYGRVLAHPVGAAFGTSALARLLILGIGGVTAVMAALSGQVSADAKGSLAYATISQVGLMFVEVALETPRLALIHLAAHSLCATTSFADTIDAARCAGAAAGRWQCSANSRRCAVVRAQAIFVSPGHRALCHRIGAGSLGGAPNARSAGFGSGRERRGDMHIGRRGEGGWPCKRFMADDADLACATLWRRLSVVGFHRDGAAQAGDFTSGLVVLLSLWAFA